MGVDARAAEPTPGEAEPGAAPTERDDEPLREQLSGLQAALRALAVAEADLAAARHRTALRRRAVDVGGPLAVALALLTAFGLANAAAVSGLSTAMAPWAAALVLAGAWVAAAALVALVLKLRADRGEGWAWWRMLTGGGPGAREALEAERARAEAEVRAELERVAPALGAAAASAIVPMASAVAAGMAAEVAAGAVETGSDLIEASDEIVESITVEMPGGGLVNQVWDVVLAPGRWGVKVVTTVLKRPPPAG
jgi:hypothetical protein